PWPSLGVPPLGGRQHLQQRLELARVGDEARAARAVEVHDLLVERRLDADAPAFTDDEAVQVIDLGAPSPHDVLAHRGPATGPRRRVAHHLGLDRPEPTALGGVDEPLGRDAEGRLDLEAAGAADADDLGAQVDGDAPRPRLGPALGGAEPAEPRERIQHAVDGELRPALAPEVRRDLRARDGGEQLGDPSRALRVAAVVLAHLEAEPPRVGAHRHARLVHAGADGDHAAERAVGAGDRRHPVVVDPVLKIDHEAVVFQILHAEPRGPLRVVRLHGDEEEVERLRDRLRLVQMERLHGDGVVATGAGQPEPAAAHRLHVLGPLVDEGDVVPRLRQQPAHHAADRARPDDPESRFHGPIAYTSSPMSGIQFDHIAIAAERIADAPPYLMGVLGGVPYFGMSAEVFRHPRDALGIVVQIVESPDEPPRGHWRKPPPMPAGPPPPVRLLGLRLRAHSAARARRQWSALLGGAESIENGVHVFRWTASPLRIAVEIDPASDEGPTRIDVAPPSRAVTGLGEPAPGLGAVFAEAP